MLLETPAAQRPPTAMTHVRDVSPSDLETALRLNDAAVPHVNRVPVETMQWFAKMAAYFRVAERDRRLLGFLVGLTRGVDYDSPNFRAFLRWFPAFAYVDRVVVDEAARGLGVGRALYEDFERFARDRDCTFLTCEVNLRPANPGSLVFHRRMGFYQVGTQQTDAGAKTVALLAKPLHAAADRTDLSPPVQAAVR